jgi:AAA domain
LTAGADDDPPFLLLPTPLDLVGEIDTLITDIAAQLDGTVPILMVLDTLNRTLVGSESRDQDMSAYIAACDRIRAQFKCAVLIVHHCGLNHERPRGHTSMTGAVDAQIAVSGRESDLIIAIVEFMKDGPDGAVFGGRRVPVEVGVDEKGKVITSCVVEDVDNSEAQIALAPKAGGRPPRRPQLVLNALEKAISQARVDFCPRGSSQPVRAVSIDAWRTCYYELSPVAGDDKAKKEARKKAFGRGIKALFEAKPPKIGIEDEHVWVR